ncbi:MAG TPA: sodium:proton antiporter [Sulfurospirillum sp. UBA11407]|jgi:putative phosphoribosyl transferase|nr:MAG TPA: sodium:proton antiporter [Sulfurospirillum sp. UBA11407]
MNNEDDKKLFNSREDAIREILDILPRERISGDEWVLISISTQAIPIVEELAKKLNLKYDLLFCEPILAPNNRECTVGMVSETEDIVLNQELVESFGINLDFIYGEAHRRYEEKILSKVYKYRKGDLIGSLEGKNVLLVDEGCETGMTVMTATKTAINLRAKSVVYVTPVLPANVAYALEPVIDEMFSVHKVSNFVDVEFYYSKLQELSSEDVIEIIKNSKHYLPFQKLGE